MTLGTPTDVGPDPVKWINRLMDVNEASQFNSGQREIIAAGLLGIVLQLERAAFGENAHRSRRYCIHSNPDLCIAPDCDCTVT